MFHSTNNSITSRILLAACLFSLGLTINRAQGQSMGISSTAITADASSILELRSTNKGLLTPRMTQTERNAIATPATGLVVYNTTAGKFNFYNGSAWVELSSGTSFVNSVTGTANRISIAGTASDPTVDISASYVGQATITTLGTVTTGTWNAGTIAVARGGTGATTAQGAINTLAGAVTSGSYLRGNGTNVVMSAIQAADVPTLNQNTTGTASNVTGTVTAANGGTGQTAYAVGDLLYASGAAALSKLAGVATGNALISGGTATAPSWGKIGLTTHVTGVLPVANGGTGQSAALVAGGVLFGSSTTAAASTAAGTTGQVLTSNGAGTPTWSYPSLTTAEAYLASNTTTGTVNTYTGALASVTLAAGTWLITSEATVEYAGGTQSYMTATVVLGTAANAAYTSGSATTRQSGNSADANVQISLSKIVTLAAPATVSLYVASDIANASVRATPTTNPSTAGTATGIHAVRIK